MEVEAFEMGYGAFESFIRSAMGQVLEEMYGINGQILEFLVLETDSVNGWQKTVLNMIEVLSQDSLNERFRFIKYRITRNQMVRSFNYHVEGINPIRNENGEFVEKDGWDVIGVDNRINFLLAVNFHALCCWQVLNHSEKTEKEIAGWRLLEMRSREVIERAAWVPYSNRVISVGSPLEYGFFEEDCITEGIKHVRVPLKLVYEALNIGLMPRFVFKVINEARLSEG